MHCGDYHTWIEESAEWVKYTEEEIGRAELRLQTRVTDLEFSGSFACALTESGGVLCWGSNEQGQLGRGTTGADEGPAPVVGVKEATALSVEGDRACAVTRGGVWCWGAGAYSARP